MHSFRANLVELLLGLSMCDVSLEHAGKTAFEWAQPGVRHSSWSFLDNKIDEGGRAKACTFFFATRKSLGKFILYSIDLCLHALY